MGAPAGVEPPFTLAAVACRGGGVNTTLSLPGGFSTGTMRMGPLDLGFL